MVKCAVYEQMATEKKASRAVASTDKMKSYLDHHMRTTFAWIEEQKERSVYIK
jgi:hypothetical protein